MTHLNKNAGPERGRLSSSIQEQNMALIYVIMNSDSIKQVTDLDWLKSKWYTLKRLGGNK